MIKKRDKFTEKEISWAINWAQGEITLFQVAKLTKKGLTSTYLFLAQALRQYVQSKRSS